MIRGLARLRRASPPPSPWAPILARGVAERLDDAEGSRVLLATSVGGHPVARIVDSLVGTAVWLRGAAVDVLLCDAALPACEQVAYLDFADPRTFARKGPQAGHCSRCFPVGAAYYEPLPFPVHPYRTLLDGAEVRAIRKRAASFDLDHCFGFEEDGLRLGEQTRASVLRFFGKADLADEPADLLLATARRYAAGALVAARVGERILDVLRPDVLVAHHGVYVPQGVLGEVARRDGVRVANWAPSYRNTTLIFSHGDTYHRTMLDEPSDSWEGRPLTADEERTLLDYLAARRRGAGDWSWITPDAGLRTSYQARAAMVEELGLDPGRPVVGLLTNVLWDAQLYYGGHGFGDMLEWLWTTIDWFAAHPELQLLVRIHPHEVKAGNRQPVAAEIAHRYEQLPANVFVVDYDHPFNTYALMELCDAVLVYGTKTGVELVPLGTRVVVAADAWIRGKGLTLDAETADEYVAILERIADLPPLDEGTIERARRYAYHYFFRRMIPVSSLDADGPELGPGIERLEELLPGVDSGLDVICDGVLTGAPFEHDPFRHAVV